MPRSDLEQLTHARPRLGGGGRVGAKSLHCCSRLAAATSSLSIFCCRLMSPVPASGAISFPPSVLRRLLELFQLARLEVVDAPDVSRAGSGGGGGRCEWTSSRNLERR